MMSSLIIGTSLPSGISLGISLASFGETWKSVIMTNIAMENPPNKWKFLAGKIIFLMGHGFHMLNNQRVYQWSTLLSLPVVLSVLKEHITCPMLHHLNICGNQKWVVFSNVYPMENGHSMMNSWMIYLVELVISMAMLAGTRGYTMRNNKLKV